MVLEISNVKLVTWKMPKIHLLLPRLVKMASGTLTWFENGTDRPKYLGVQKNFKPSRSTLPRITEQNSLQRQC